MALINSLKNILRPKLKPEQWNNWRHWRTTNSLIINYAIIWNLLTQLEIHKPGVSVRPIVSYSGFSLYDFSKYIASILKTIHKLNVKYVKISNVKYANNNAKNSTTFSNYFRNIPIKNGEIMVSFDVTFLYTNIPVINRLSIIKDYVNNDDHCTKKTAIPQNKFLDLVNLVLTTIWYTFNYQFYEEPDGVVMRGTASWTTVKISTRMRAYERTAIFTAIHYPKVWQQLIGDVYSTLI